MKKTIAIFEITFMVLATIAFAYIMAQVQTPVQSIQKESGMISLAREKFISWFGGNLVSAEELQGFWTCPVNKQGSACQEYPAAVCDSQCGSPCFQSERENFAQCTLGTCIDPSSGVCSPNSPKSSCETEGGKWSATTPAECNPGCCVLGDQTNFVNAKTCDSLATKRGIVGVFKPEVNTEMACSLLATPNEEGACVFKNEDDANTCVFGTKLSCQGRNGAFYSGVLCSAQELATNCVKQATTGCVADKDEVYWFDSCGNRENIFDANKVKSWNNGKVLAKSDSCELGSIGNPLLKQTTCGNCDYIGGSVCGTTRSNDDKPVVGNFVCRDLSCVDENGQERKQGESWCAFNSQIGVQGSGNDARSVDVPGSRHFRKSCLNGEVTTSPCDDFRNGVCYEERDEKVGFSSAACRPNQRQLCLKANDNPESQAKCEENPDCLLKSVDIDANFKFSLCVPRYPPGFDITEEEESGDASALCGLGTWTCTYQKTKGSLFSGDKVANANCKTPEFTETLNNLCMSLGDCGQKVNIVGDLGSSGYQIDGAPELGADYLSKLTRLSQPQSGQFVAKQTRGADTRNDVSESLTMISAVAGLAGIGLVYAASAGIGAEILGAGGLGLTEAGFASEGFTFAPGLAGAGGAVVGAAVGAAAAALIIQYTGIGRGMSSTEVAALVGLAAVGGAGIGFAVAGGTTVIAGTGWIPVVGWVVVIVVGAYLLISWLTGVGKTQTADIKFTCLPWQPPRGGEKCNECGKNGLPCSKYQCQSLGLTCEFINEGTLQQECVNIAPKDVSAPVISPDSSVLQTGFSYEVAADGNGYVVKGPGTDACLPAGSYVDLGIKLDEPGQCRFEAVPTANFDAMHNSFDTLASNVYVSSHRMSFIVPNLDALTPTPQNPIVEKKNFALYLRCIDKPGNSNIREYSISFCVNPELDKTAPAIRGFVPASESSVALDATEKEISFVVDKPAECKWSLTDQTYDMMSNEVTCDTGTGQQTISAGVPGWGCRVKLPAPADVNKYYFRCKDQPWLTGAETDGRTRNVNVESIPYTLKKTATALAITSVSPNGETISSGSVPIGVDLKVTTSGGAEGGGTRCSFAMSDTGAFSEFFSTGGIGSTNEHTQPGLTFYVAKTYTLPIKCEDEVGNKATSSVSFSLFVDNKGPLITRVYDSGGLNVITSEKATCAISKNSCTFDFDGADVTLMSGSEFAHTSAIDAQITQFVKCKDDYGNVGSCIAVKKGVF